MANHIIQIIIAGAQVVARAFTRAMRQEIQASQQAAQRLGNTKAQQNYVDNTKLGISLEEAKQILNISDLNEQDVQKRYEHLFKANEKSSGGSFYLQSKVVRAKERVDHEFKTEAASETTKPPENP